MDPLDIAHIDQIRLQLHDAVDVHQALFQHLVLGIEQAFLALGVGGIDGPVVGREEHQTGFFFGLQHNRCVFFSG